MIKKNSTGYNPTKIEFRHTLTLLVLAGPGAEKNVLVGEGWGGLGRVGWRVPGRTDNSSSPRNNSHYSQGFK